MPDEGKPATGPLIMEQMVQLVSVMDDLRQIFETHTGAAVQHRETELQKFEDLSKDIHYYGSQLVKVYHDLNANVRHLTELLERAQLHEEEQLAEQDKAA